MLILLKKAFIYARVSTKQQLEGDGFGRQIEACHKFARSAGFTIARTFTEQQTGSDEYIDRKQLMEAIDFAGSNSPYGVSAIIVERSDRIARDLLVSEMFFKACRKAGIEVYAADSGQELVNAQGDPTVVLIRQFLGAVAQWEKVMLQRKLLSGRRRKKMETGLPCGGPPRYNDQWVISEIIRMRHEYGLSFGEIAKRLTRRKIPTPYQLKRKGTTDEYRSWNRNSVYQIYQDNRPEGPESLCRLLDDAMGS